MNGRCSDGWVSEIDYQWECWLITNSDEFCEQTDSLESSGKRALAEQWKVGHPKDYDYFRRQFMLKALAEAGDYT